MYYNLNIKNKTTQLLKETLEKNISDFDYTNISQIMHENPDDERKKLIN